MSAAAVEGNGAVTGHIISTTIGGKNGEPKRVCTWYMSVSLVLIRLEIQFFVISWFINIGILIFGVNALDGLSDRIWWDIFAISFLC